MRLFGRFIFNSKEQVAVALRKYCLEHDVPHTLGDIYAMLDEVLGDCYRLEFPEMRTQNTGFASSSVLVSFSALYETGEVMFTRQQWGVMGHGTMDTMFQEGIIKAEVNAFCLILSDLGALPGSRIRFEQLELIS